jgi:hypothetical protein
MVYVFSKKKFSHSSRSLQIVRFSKPGKEVRESYLFLYDGQSLRIDNESFDLFQYVSHQDGHFIVISAYQQKQSIRMRHQAIFQSRKVCIISKFRERILDDVRVESKASFRNEDFRRSGTLTSLIQRHELTHCNG